MSCIIIKPMIDRESKAAEEKENGGIIRYQNAINTKYKDNKNERKRSRRKIKGAHEEKWIQ